MQLKSGTRKCSLIFFYLRFLSGSDSRVLRCCLGFEPCLKKKKSKHKGHKSQRLVASFCYKASGQVALLYLFNSFALWLCNLQRATLKFCSMFCCIIQKESLKKNPTTCTGTMLHSRSSHGEKQIRFCFFLVMQLEDVLFGCKGGIHGFMRDRREGYQRGKEQ